MIPFGNELRCPVRALIDWRQASKLWDGYIFRRISKTGTISQHGITGVYVNILIRDLVKTVGLPNAEQYSAHSLRRGLRRIFLKINYAQHILNTFEEIKKAHDFLEKRCDQECQVATKILPYYSCFLVVSSNNALNVINLYERGSIPLFSYGCAIPKNKNDFLMNLAISFRYNFFANVFRVIHELIKITNLRVGETQNQRVYIKLVEAIRNTSVHIHPKIDFNNLKHNSDKEDWFKYFNELDLNGFILHKKNKKMRSSYDYEPIIYSDLTTKVVQELLLIFPKYKRAHDYVMG